MRLPSDEELILHYYGEADDPKAIEEAIAGLPEVAARFDALRSVLDAVPRIEVPDRSELYGRRVWRELSPRLADRHATSGETEERGHRWPARLGWSLAGALAASLLLVVAFWTGRATAPSSPVAATLSEAARGRILRLSVAEHLERSQFLLQEISNAAVESGDESLDEVHQLLVENRLYRQAARRAGYNDLGELLGELELYLTDIEHLEPSSPTELGGLQERLRQTDLLFKVRVTVAALERQATPTSPATTT